MNGQKKKIFLWVQALLCAAAALTLVLSALTVYAQGISARRAGDTLGWIFTPERVASWRVPVVAALVFCLLWAVIGWIAGMRGEEKRPLIRKIPVQGELKSPWAARGAALALGAAFLLIGIMNGGWRDVLVKAVNLCAECVGLG